MMTHARILYSLITCLLIGAHCTAAEQTKPNIMFIFADDQTYESIGAYGLTEVITPNLDRLVNRGVKNNLRRGESPPSETLTYETNFSRTVGSLRQPLHETVHKQTSLKTRGTP